MVLILATVVTLCHAIRPIIVRDTDSSTGFNENKLDENIFRIYPNPATDWITISSERIWNGYTMIKVYDLLGKLTLTTEMEINGSHSMDINSLNPAFYLVAFENNGNLFTKKIIKK